MVFSMLTMMGLASGPQLPYLDVKGVNKQDIEVISVGLAHRASSA